MKKYLAMILVTCVVMTGCGKKEVNVDVSSLGNRLNTEISYSDDLGEVDIDMAGRLMNLSDVNIVNGAVFIGAGATAEEIVVLECATTDDAIKAKSAFVEHVREQKELFADYAPEEVVKLNSAVIDSAGKYAVMCICGDEAKASDIVKEAFK